MDAEACADRKNACLTDIRTTAKTADRHHGYVFAVGTDFEPVPILEVCATARL
ncbi:Uncharacterised protein [Mycobacteroides abscessus]|nr:Uncharacterised protein [Mycobacteroides abscessus]